VPFNSTDSIVKSGLQTAATSLKGIQSTTNNNLIFKHSLYTERLF
jgi:hypothetical protein